LVDATDLCTSFGEVRLIDLIAGPHASADALLGRLAAALESHAAGIAPFDDITMLAVRRAGPPAPPRASGHAAFRGS
jgi:serine phosphatase RsbU (regulator of sigma subunit)